MEDPEVLLQTRRLSILGDYRAYLIWTKVLSLENNFEIFHRKTYRLHCMLFFELIIVMYASESFLISLFENEISLRNLMNHCIFKYNIELYIFFLNWHGKFRKWHQIDMLNFYSEYSNIPIYFQLFGSVNDKFRNRFFLCIISKSGWIFLIIFLCQYFHNSEKSFGN